MDILEFKKLLLGSSILLSASVVALAPTAFAQENADENTDTIVLDDEEQADETKNAETKDNVIVTGTRIKKDTFTSISPIQTITTEATKDVGLFDPAQILQQSEAAAGQQIDATFNGFVLDNGPGSQTLNLRGLGANRTLLLVNGRRLAPAGVEGAPSSPSINLLPSNLIERFDLLLDGASSVYGSDAVAGVGNIILRKDFDGLELEISADRPEQSSAGTDYTLSATYGVNNDRGFLGFGAEYDFRDAVRIEDRDFFGPCETTYEITDTGEIRRDDISRQLLYNRIGLNYPVEECRLTGLGRRIRRVPGGLGFVYYTPGQSNTGIPNFSEDIQFGVPVDGDGDGNVDVVYGDYTSNGAFNNATFISEQKRISLMAYGEYTLEGEANVTPYFEALHTSADVFIDSGASQLFTVVPANNPFNPCNPNQPNGVDCGLAADSLLTNPNFVESFRNYYSGGPGSANCFGLPRALCTPTSFGLLNGALGPQRAGGGVVVEGDRDITNITVAQTRLVAGVKGDLPFMNFGSFSNWSFDNSFSLSISKGKSSRPGIRDDRLHFALGFDPNIRNATNQLVDLQGGPCVADPGSVVSADIADGCVPVNLFAPSLYDNVIGDFATQAERDYLFDTRDFDTTYIQSVINGFVTGTILEVPAGNVNLVLGAELRYDELDSIPDNVARDGLFFGFFSDQGASGSKVTKEAFAEIDIPVVADKPFFKQLDLNAAGRLTDDEFYGTNYTYSVKSGWRPFEALLLKATHGTSFRAPNLRENFLAGTSGFRNLTDPCVTPPAAVGLNGQYIAANDPRDPITIANCAADPSGLDPTNFSPIPGNVQTYSVETRQGGALDLDAETSKSYTVGFAFEQPFFDSFDANLNVNYYSVKVKNTVISPSAQFIINDCYTLQANRQSAFCSRISRSALNATANAGQFNLIDSGFINQDEENVSGVDINLDLSKDIQMFDRSVDWALDVRANYLEKRTSLFVDNNGNRNFNDTQGEFGFPEWTGRATLTADWDRWRATWQSRYVGPVEQDPVFIDAFSDAFLGGAQTCGGPTVGDASCRDVGFADEYITHAVSVRYTGDTITVVAGVNNLFDKAPPLVDPTEVQSINNVALGTGYDYDGRQFFINIRKKFN